MDLGALDAPRTVIYGYPRTSEPGKPAPTGWDVTPGDAVYGLSTHDTAYQAEMAVHLHLPFAVLSDARFELADALDLPCFEADGMHLLQRPTLVIRGTTVEEVFRPVPQPERSATDVVAWLRTRPDRCGTRPRSGRCRVAAAQARLRQHGPEAVRQGREADAVHTLNRMPDSGRPRYVRIA